ncbi:protein-tyrosine phosphatase family protein [Desulfohalovibrio reitneri]|uniref:protein-tyrosine phosphatase family protein n=1 Tax=Desulfohalovibrio reitneri TaxID=1307759 RepID=UPI0004A6DBC6|nr:dual specificity protein phosphatase family protein [Desulfohalovibrio reitneri]
MGAKKKEVYELRWITDSLAVGSAPMSYADLESIKDQGVRAVLNLCAEFCDLHWLESESGLEVYYLPIPDEKAPDMDELEKALEWLDGEIYLGRKVLVHCRFGIGRTGTVIKAWLLRKGLTSKQADKRLHGFRSQPANFGQWRFLRRYGKQQSKLTIREPSLEHNRQVDLAPFFADYEALLERLDEELREQGVTERCGMEHDGCCTSLVRLSLAAAVYIHHASNLSLGRRDREEVKSRAVEAGKTQRRVQREVRARTGHGGLTPEVSRAYRKEGVTCPLSELGECRIFPQRPVSCRLSDLPREKRAELRLELSPSLRKLSGDLFQAYAGTFPKTLDATFSLNNVLTGRFVQEFFHLLVKNEASRGAAAP